MAWTELKSAEVQTSKGVTLRVTVSESPKGAKVVGIRKWIQRNGAEPIPTKDGFAVTLADDTVSLLIDALKKIE